MQLKDKADIQVAISEAHASQGFQASANSSAVAADQVEAACASVAAMYSDVSAIPIATIIALAMQLLPIIFGDGGFTLEKLQAVLTLIQQIFV